MAWIESHTVLLRHRKLIALAGVLRLRPIYVMGHLTGLWHTSLEQQEDGDLTLWPDQTIADAAAFDGSAKRFVSALQTHRWLGYHDTAGAIIPGTERLIHDWVDYAGRFLTARYSTSNRERLVEIWQKHRKVYGNRRSGENEGTSKREVSEKNLSPPSSTNPTRPTQPTNPTRPTQPTNQPDPTHPADQPGTGGNGSGLRGNSGGGRAGKSVRDLLTEAKVNSEVQREFLSNPRITAAMVSSLLQRVKCDPSVEDVPRILVFRLREAVKVKS